MKELPPPPPEEFPKIFGAYTLLTSLARGGMGDVFLARHGSVAGLEKQCVVKTLRPHLTDDREYTTRFIDEARVVVQLGHHNICHVFDVGRVGERYYLAMEHIAGRDLRALAQALVDRGGVMNQGLALHVLCEVLEALDYAHRHVDAATGQPLLLVHRDVSPQNVMLSFEGEVKLIDFGLAASTLKMEQTSPNVVMGKLAYMAPEQVRGERVDGRADLFAAAIVLYELLVGERFYEGKSPFEIWGIASQGGFRPRGWTVLDADLRDVLERALAADPRDRFATCLAFREALVQLRLARGLHGDGPVLRALMQQVYAEQIEDERRGLATLMQAPLRAAGAGLLQLEPHEQTHSIVRASSQPGPRAARRLDEGTGPTDRIVAPRQPGRPALSGPALAAMGGVLLVGVAGIAFSLGRGDALRSEGAGRPAVVAADAPVAASAGRVAAAAPDAATDAATGGTLGTASTVEPAGAASSPAAPRGTADTAAAAGATGDPGAGGARPRASMTAATQAPSAPTLAQVTAVTMPAAAPTPLPAAASPAAATTASATTAGTTTAGTTTAGSTTAGSTTAGSMTTAPQATQDLDYRAMTWEQRVGAIAARCPSLPCLEDARAHVDDFGEFSRDTRAFAAWKDGVKACWRACGLR